MFVWPREELIESLRWLALFGSVCGIVITLWIRHNIGIFRRKGSRLQLKKVSTSFEKDVLGRPVVLVTPSILHESCVVLELKNGTKVYSPGATEPLEPGMVRPSVGME